VEARGAAEAARTAGRGRGGPVGTTPPGSLPVAAESAPVQQWPQPESETTAAPPRPPPATTPPGHRRHRDCNGQDSGREERRGGGRGRGWGYFGRGGGRATISCVELSVAGLISQCQASCNGLYEARQCV
jgi:hypothetical protein